MTPRFRADTMLLESGLFWVLFDHGFSPPRAIEAFHGEGAEARAREVARLRNAAEARG